jgi:cytochrome c peroxidase
MGIRSLDRNSITSWPACPAPLPTLNSCPERPSSSFDHTAADRGRERFSGKAKCSTCRADAVFTEPGWTLHKASDVCVDDFQADRAPHHAYRTTPLNGLWTHTKGGFYHDGRFATLADVVNHYDTCFSLGLAAQEQGDVVEYMKSLEQRK